MNKIEFQALAQPLLKQLFQEILSGASSNGRKQKDLEKAFSGLSLLTKLSFERWSRFPYSRHTLKLDWTELASPEYLNRLLALLAENSAELLAREFDGTSITVLASCEAEQFEKALKEIWLNKFTAKELSRFLLVQAMEPELKRLIETAFSK